MSDYTVFDMATGNVLSYVPTLAEAWRVVDGTLKANPGMDEDDLTVLRHDDDKVREMKRGDRDE